MWTGWNVHNIEALTPLGRTSHTKMFGMSLELGSYVENLRRFIIHSLSKRHGPTFAQNIKSRTKMDSNYLKLFVDRLFPNQ